MSTDGILMKLVLHFSGLILYYLYEIWKTAAAGDSSHDLSANSFDYV